MPGLRLCTLLLALGAASAVVRAQAPASSNPLTPGAVVLLAGSRGPEAADTVARALSERDAMVRRAAARVISVAHPDVFGALREALDREQDPVVIAEFVRDVLALTGAKGVPLVEPAVARAGIEAVASLAEWLARSQPDEFVKRLPQWGTVAGARERLDAIVEFALLRHPDQRDRILDSWKPIATDTAWQRLSKLSQRQPPVTTRTIAGLALDLLPDTLAAAKCQPAPDAMGSVKVTFSADGRPNGLEVDDYGLSAGCRQALVALARISLEPYDSAGKPQTLVVPMIPAFVACIARPFSQLEVKNIEPHSGVRSPRLTKEVKPSYTRRAFDEKIEGHTEMEAVLSAGGCVRWLTIQRSLAPDLDIRAMIAALQWRFDPATFDGHPVAVVINIDMKFTMR